MCNGFTRVVCTHLYTCSRCILIKWVQVWCRCGAGCLQRSPSLPEQIWLSPAWSPADRSSTSEQCVHRTPQQCQQSVGTALTLLITEQLYMYMGSMIKVCTSYISARTHKRKHNTHVWESGTCTTPSYNN